jgi:RimJ/RimL family protein N-acetyltransferase
MQVEVRPVEARDHEAIFAIERRPEVREQQYDFGLKTLPQWQARYFGYYGPTAIRRHLAVTVDEATVGVIYCWSLRISFSSKRRGIYGWNLHPDFWGRGIMRQALTLELDRLFDEPHNVSAVADCFHDNARCLRLLDRLSFTHQWIGPLDRLHLLSLSRRHVKRFRMTREHWRHYRGVAR